MPYKYICVVITGSLLALSAGTMSIWFDMIYSQDHNKKDSPLYGITPSKLVSLRVVMYVGAILAPAFVIYDHFKRGSKWVFITCAVTILLAIILFHFANTVELYYIAQFIAGLAFGGSTISLLAYYAEISNPAQRPSALASVSAALAFGKLITYVLSKEMSTLGFNMVLAIIPCTFAVICIAYMPLSPYFLLLNTRETEAVQVITKLRGGKFEQNELEEIRTIQQAAISKRRTTLIICALLFVHKLTGVFHVQTYTIYIWTKSQGGEYEKTIIFYVIEFLSCILGLGLISIYHKSLILAISCIIMTICNVTFTMIQYDVYYSTAITAIGVIWSISFYMGLGIIPWVLMAEMLPVYGNGVGLVVAASANWFFWVISTMLLPLIITDSSALYWISIFFSIAGIPVSALCFRDTRGKSLKQIREM